jgi:hypothetical protein
METTANLAGGDIVDRYACGTQCAGNSRRRSHAPVLIGNRLYIRNSQEAACYELPLASEPVAVRDAK